MTEPAPNPPNSPIIIALTEAHKELKNPSKDAANPYFNSRYATLDALQDASRTILAKHGLCITQVCQPVGQQPLTSEKVVSKTTDKDGHQIEQEGFKLHPFLWELRTLLMHTSGATIESRMPLVMVTRGAQQFGSELTYMRRYAYAAILNITADEDDDANAATQDGKELPKKEEPPKKEKEPRKKKEEKKEEDVLESTPTFRPTTEKGPIDDDLGPDEIPGLTPEHQGAPPPEKEEIPPWLKEPGSKPRPEEQTLLEQVKERLADDGISEEELMTLIRSFKLTREIMLNKVKESTLSTILNKWETVQNRIKSSRELFQEEKRQQTLTESKKTQL